MKHAKLALLVVGALALSGNVFAENGNTGPQGPPGPQGSTGARGQTGAPGVCECPPNGAFDPCICEDIVIQDGNKLCVNQIGPASTCKETPCECDKRGTTCFIGNVGINKTLFVNHIDPVAHDGCDDCVEDHSPQASTCFSGKVKIDKDLHVRGNVHYYGVRSEAEGDVRAVSTADSLAAVTELQLYEQAEQRSIAAYDGINLTQLIADLVGAVQELGAQNKSLKATSQMQWQQISQLNEMASKKRRK